MCCPRLCGPAPLGPRNLASGLAPRARHLAPAGKTTLLSQVAALSADGELLPILVKVQRLQGLLRQSNEAFASAWNWIDALLRLEHGQGSPLYRMLRQAMAARRALLLIDGLDEGGTLRSEIEQHVAEVLAPQGHVLLATSRPAGVDGVRFAPFRQLQLSPLSEAQQERALEQRLGTAGIEALRPYLARIPCDTSSGLRATANPLMLSMVASVFELRQGVDMPENISGLYETASEAMLARGGVTSPDRAYDYWVQGRAVSPPSPRVAHPSREPARPSPKPPPAAPASRTGYASLGAAVPARRTRPRRPNRVLRRRKGPIGEERGRSLDFLLFTG